MDYRIVTIGQQLTRAANTTAYFANAVILGTKSSKPGTSIQEALGGSVSGGNGTILRATVLSDHAIGGNLALWLFSADPGVFIGSPTIVDGTVLSSIPITYAVSKTLIAIVPLTTPNALLATNTIYDTGGISIPIKVGAGTTVYGLLQTVAGFTPVSGQNITVAVYVGQNS